MYWGSTFATLAGMSWAYIYGVPPLPLLFLYEPFMPRHEAFLRNGLKSYQPAQFLSAFIIVLDPWEAGEQGGQTAFGVWSLQDEGGALFGCPGAGE